MPRRKIPVSLIGNRRTRVVTYAKRKEGLMKKARELATLCDIPVAVVCAGPDGGAPDVWSSEDGVIDRYRALATEKKAGHTHRAYLRDQLGKEKAKLARLQQDGPDELGPPDVALNGMTLEELQRLLESIDGTLRATAERRRALGLLADGDTMASSMPDAAAVLGHHGIPCPGNISVGLHAYHQGHEPGNGDQLGQFTWNTFQPYNAGVPQPGYNVHHMCGHGHGVDMNDYPLRMPSNGNNHHRGLPCRPIQPINAVVQPSYSHLHCSDINGVGGQAPANGHWHNAGTWANGETCNAIVPVGYPYLDIGHNCMNTHVVEYHTPNTTSNIGDNFVSNIGDNFVDEAVQFLTMGSDESSVVNAGGGYGTQCSDASQNSCNLEQLHYLSDLADGLDFGSCDGPLDLDLWED